MIWNALHGADQVNKRMGQWTVPRDAGILRKYVGVAFAPFVKRHDYILLSLRNGLYGQIFVNTKSILNGHQIQHRLGAG